MVAEGKDEGKGQLGSLGWTRTYTLLYLKWPTNKDLLSHTRSSAERQVAAWLGGEFGGDWYVCTCGESLHCPPEMIARLLICYTPVQRKSLIKVITS